MKSNINSVNKELHDIKAIVITDTISISDLLKLSFRLIKIRLQELLALYFSASLISSAESFFFKINRQISYVSGWGTHLQVIISGLFNLFLSVLLLSAIMSVYDTGHLYFTNVLKKAIRVYLKYLWTFLILAMLFTTGFLILFFLIGFVLLLIIPSKSMLLLSAVLLSPVVIWFFARTYFIPYIVVYHNRYGPSAIARSFALTKGCAWRMIRYLIPIALLTSLILVPIAFTIRGDIILSNLIFIPVGMTVLLPNTYGFILYLNFVRKAA